MEIVLLETYGHVTEEHMAAVLAEIENKLPLECALLLDTTDLVGYDMGARPIFIDWLNENLAVKRVAVVAKNYIWPLVVSTMAPRIRADIAAFHYLNEATEWLQRP